MVRSEVNTIVKKFSHKSVQHYFLSDALNVEQLKLLFENLRPSVVINCTSLSKNKLRNSNPLEIIPIYSLLPHILADFCYRFSARFIQISSDGVFSGARGGYCEKDIPDAPDLYGRAKLLGEATGQSCVTLRTSMLGHNSNSTNGLVSWFLNQKESCLGFTEAIFSGFPVTTLARIIRDQVLPQEALRGLYNLASTPISKFDLLLLIADIYSVDIMVVPDNSIKINRSLDASKFNTETGYAPPSWHDLIVSMRDDYLNLNQ